MKTYEECCSEVAKKYDLGTKLVTGHREKYWTESAELYCSQYKEEVERLKEALIQIENPIKFFHKELEEGEQLNGVMANQLSNDPNYLKEIARKALQS